MNSREVIIPAATLVAAVLLGSLLVWNANRTERAGGPGSAATSTVATTTPDEPAEGDGRPSAAGGARGGVYAYGPVTLSLNQPAGFANGLSIRPIAVAEDSRCPQGAQCVQAGMVKVQVRANARVAGKTASEVYTIALGETVRAHGTPVTLVSVAPQPTAGEEFPSAAYRFTFRVDGPAGHAGSGMGGGAAAGPCYVGGCSSQLCTEDPQAISTCEFRAEYACYRGARCERQASGACGWTPTPELTRCLANPPALD